MRSPGCCAVRVILLRVNHKYYNDASFNAFLEVHFSSLGGASGG